MDYSILGSILGSACLGKLPYLFPFDRLVAACLVPGPSLYWLNRFLRDSSATSHGGSYGNLDL